MAGKLQSVQYNYYFLLRFIALEGTSLPETLVLDPAHSNITILGNYGLITKLVYSYPLIYTYTEMTVGFINPPYSAGEDEGPMIFTVGVTSDHILDRDIELSFSTADGLIAGESLHYFMTQ